MVKYRWIVLPEKLVFDKVIDVKVGEVTMYESVLNNVVVPEDKIAFTIDEAVTKWKKQNT